MLLLINTLQRDLNSPNHLDICAALTSVSRLVNSEMVPAVFPTMMKLLGHQQEYVRKKAIMALHRLQKVAPEQMETHEARQAIRKCVCDPDPSVMAATLNIIFEITKTNPSSTKDLVPSLVSILKQITEHRLPREYDYHRVPAPWVQIRILCVLGMLGQADQRASGEMYETIQEALRRADSGVNVGYAIIFECVKTITKIYPSHELLELAATNIGRFISSDNHNLKYLGVTGLALIVQVNPVYAAEHQMTVVECLEDPDDTLKRKTLDLLFRMTNGGNVTVVVDKFVTHLRTSVDQHLRRELVNRISELAERFSPDNEWYVRTMTQVLELGGSVVPEERAFGLMKLIADGSGADEDADTQFREFVVNTYVTLLEKTTIPDLLVQVTAWILGEYASLCSLDGYAVDDIIDLLADALDRPFEMQSTKGYLLTAIMKLTAQQYDALSTNPQVKDTMTKFRNARSTDLQQRCYEFGALCQPPGGAPLMQEILPYDAFSEEVDTDSSLSFLDGYVQSALAKGAKPYRDELERERTKMSSKSPVKGALKFDAYELPTKHTPVAIQEVAPPNPMEPTGGGGSMEAPKPAINAGNRKWGPTGYVGPQSMEPEKPKAQPPPPPSSGGGGGGAAPPPPPSSGPWGKAGPPKAEPEKPKELTEKERMAAALFGGGPAVAPKAAKAAKKASKPKSRVAPKMASRPAAAVDNLLGDGPVAPAAPVAAAPTAAPDLMDDLFGDMGGGSSPATSAPAGSPAAATPVVDLLGGDLLGFDDPAPAPSPPATTGGYGAMGSPAGASPGGMSGSPSPAGVSPAAMGGKGGYGLPPLLQPVQMTTQQMAGQWGRLPAEKKVQVPSGINSAEMMMTRMKEQLNVFPVQIIGSEGICAGASLQGGGNCFLHGKVIQGGIELIVKAGTPQLAQAVVERATAALR